MKISFDSDIQEAIEKYLQARKLILEIGEMHPDRIGGNDNIIGRIGEFIALRFLEAKGQRPIKVSGSSNPGYDMIEGSTKTQVKVITNENKKGRSVRLKQPWNQFLLIELGEHYKPERIGLISEVQHKIALSDNPTWSPNPIVKLTMLGEKGLVGRYGKVYLKDEIRI